MWWDKHRDPWAFPGIIFSAKLLPPVLPSSEIPFLIDLPQVCLTSCTIYISLYIYIIFILSIYSTYVHTLHVCQGTLDPYLHHIIGTSEVPFQKNQPKTAPKPLTALPWSICCPLPKFLPEEWMESKSCPMVWMKLCLFIRSLFSGNNLLATRMLCYTTSSFLPGNLQFTHCTST